jgi:tRNA threonylcarbamoyladenosine biosynthesis protein TsaB
MSSRRPGFWQVLVGLFPDGARTRVVTVAFRCLAIETATQNGSVAAVNGDRAEILRLDDARSSSRQLYRMVTDVLERVNLDPQELDCLAFGCGPGSFTGVRVAAAAVQGLAFALAKPVCSVSSLAALAAAAAKQAGTYPVAACLDARMGEVYLGLYDRGPDGVPEALLPDRLLRPAEYRCAAGSPQFVAAGNGWGAWPEMLSNNEAFVLRAMPDVWPDALTVTELASVQFAAGCTTIAARALPNYIRDQVTG